MLQACLRGGRVSRSTEAVRVEVVLRHALQSDTVELAGRVGRHLVEEDDLLGGLVADAPFTWVGA
jgi:hypothetical protein